MKTLIPILTFLAGLSVGWYVFRQSDEEVMRKHLPEDFMNQVDIMLETPGFESKEALGESMEYIRKYAAQATNEADLRTFWGALEAHRYKMKVDDGGLDLALDHANERLEYFRKRYEEGIEVGEWQKIADAIYTKMKEEENQLVEDNAGQAPL